MYQKVSGFVIFGCMSVCIIACPLYAAPNNKPWKDAGEVYKAAMKLYVLRQWQDALAALDGFAEDFPTNENVPLAYLQIAYCNQVLKQPDAKLKNLEKVTQAFPDTMAAYYAWSVLYYDKMNKARALFKKTSSEKTTDEDAKSAQNAFKDFVIFLENIEKQFGGLFISPNCTIDWPRPEDYYAYYSPERMVWAKSLGYQLELYPLNGWNYKYSDQIMANNLLELVTDSSKADSILSALQPCFKKLNNDLPASWKLLHVKLLQKKRGGENSAKIQLGKYEDYYKKDDPMIIELKALELNDAWDEKNTDKIVEINNYFVDNFMGFEDLDAPFSRWMDYLYASGEAKEFIRISKLYMDKTPEGACREAILDRWANLSKKSVVKPDEAIAIIDTDQAIYYPLNKSRSKRNLIRKIEIYLAEKNSSDAAKNMTTLLSREYWSKESFEWISKIASGDVQYKVLVNKICEQYGIINEKAGTPACLIYNDLQRRINQKNERFIEELATKLYSEYRRDYYTIMGIYSVVKFFYSKAAHQQRDKWADMMLSVYPLHPLSQEVIQWQINASDAVKNFEMLAKWTDLGITNFPGASAVDNWINMRLSCFDATTDLQGRLSCARKFLQARAETGEPAAVRLLGQYECQAMDTAKQQCAYWLGLAEKYKGKYAEVVCNQMAWRYGYIGPIAGWEKSTNTIDFESAARAMSALAEQNYRPDWKWKAMFDDVNILCMISKGPQAMQILVKKLPKLKSAVGLHRRLNLPRLGFACGRAKLQNKDLGTLSKIRSLLNTDEGKLNGMIMFGHMYKFGGQNKQASKTYLAASEYYKRPVMKWQLVMLAYGCLSLPEQIVLFSSYASQLKTAQDRRPWLLYCIGKNYIAEKKNQKAKSVFEIMLKAYKASSYTGCLADELAETTKTEQPAKKEK